MCVCVQALDVCGLKPSEAQQQVIRSRLKADPAGTVAFTGETTSARSCGAPGFRLLSTNGLVFPEVTVLISQNKQPSVDLQSVHFNFTVTDLWPTVC